MSVRQIAIVNQVLTNIARGYRNAELIAESLFPTVYVDKEGIEVPLFGRDAFKIYQTERAPRADSNVMTPTADGSLPLVLKEHDLAYPVDYREQAAAMYNRTVRAAKTVTNSLLLSHEKTCADIAQNVANYASTNKLVLSTGSQLENMSAPVLMFADGMEAVRAQIGIKPNKVVFGAKPWKTFSQHPAILDRLAMTGTKILTEELAAQILEVKEVKVGRAVYDTDRNVKTDIWGNVIILAYVPESQTADERSEYDPSFAYTFRHREAAMVVDEYPSKDLKTSYVRCTDVRKAAIVGADAGFLFSNVTGTGFTSYTFS